MPAILGLKSNFGGLRKEDTNCTEHVILDGGCPDPSLNAKITPELSGVIPSTGNATPADAGKITLITCFESNEATERSARVTAPVVAVNEALNMLPESPSKEQHNMVLGNQVKLCRKTKKVLPISTRTFILNVNERLTAAPGSAGLKERDGVE